MLLTVLGTATPYPRPDAPCSGYLVQSGAGASAGAGNRVDGEPGATDSGATDAGATDPGATSARATNGGATDARARDGGVTDAGTTSIWVDAGTGTLAELQRHTALAELDAIWISHRHADHSADLLVAYYALRFAELRPAAPIPLIGPEGLLDRLAAFLGPSSVDELPRVFDFTPMNGWGERRVGSLTLSWGPVQHGVPAFGLTVDESPELGGQRGADAPPERARRLAYSGDSAPCLSLEEIAEDADLLLLETGYSESPGRDSAEAPAHHSPDDAGRTATAARASRLVLTHLAAGVAAADAVARASAHFSGPVTLATPGATYLV
ncbi:MAG: MBL fold metallo-hydrolase [Herbiconiux sp.]|nr:MBL fold metallo-hydrolase [Herbiconiux sp.]